MIPIARPPAFKHGLAFCALAVAGLAVPAWAAQPASGLDLLAEFNLAASQGTLDACRKLDAKAAAGMQTELLRLKPQLQNAMQKAFVDVPELQQAPQANGVEALRELAGMVSDGMAEIARLQGPAFCQSALQGLKSISADELAESARAHFDKHLAKVLLSEP